MAHLSTTGVIGLIVGAQLAPSAQAMAQALEADLPPAARNDEVWPWLVAAAVVVLIATSAVKMFTNTFVTRRDVDSFEAWNRTESEIAPRAHTSSRLPSRDAAPPKHRREQTREHTAEPTAGPAAGAASSFGRRSA